MVVLSEFDKVLIVFLLVVFGIIFGSAAVFNPAKPFHEFTQMGYPNGGTFEGVTNRSGVLKPAFGGTGVAVCADGNVLKWSGGTNGNWICGKDNSGTVTGGSIPDCPENSILESDGTKWTCVAKPSAQLILPICEDGNVLKWNGGWECGNATEINNYGARVFDIMMNSSRVSLVTTTWTVPSGISKVRVDVWGGGGGGAYNGSGGGAGKYESKEYTVSAGQVFSIKQLCNTYYVDVQKITHYLCGVGGYFYLNDCVTNYEDCCNKEIAKSNRYGYVGDNTEVIPPSGSTNKILATGGVGGSPQCGTIVTGAGVIPYTNPVGVYAGAGGNSNGKDRGSNGLPGRVIIYQIA